MMLQKLHADQKAAGIQPHAPTPTVTRAAATTLSSRVRTAAAPRAARIIFLHLQEDERAKDVYTAT